MSVDAARSLLSPRPLHDQGFARRHGFDAGFCLRHGVLPLYSVGTAAVVLAETHSVGTDARVRLERTFGSICVVPASRADLQAQITDAFATDLIERTILRLPDAMSCRSLSIPRDARIFLAAVFLVLLAMFVRWPGPGFAILCLLVSGLIVVSTGLKLAAALLGRHATEADSPEVSEQILPVITVLLPLFRESEIAGKLTERVARLDYPRDRLDVCLVIEEDDAVTRTALVTTQLPPWMRVIVVPQSSLKTKPRAMNFAVDYARGSIIGIYDAEDAPAPDHLRRVARAFAKAPPEVVCLQGILDFYNARYNWLSRCFTIDYATWFRLILPGFWRLGLVLPLGGTTLFFRRDALEELGCWDAHNVTEDADLGIRLARHGYRTDLLPIVTMEEANSAVWPWIKQRSRWLKGYAMTWAVHMRDPARLWRDLGPWRFFGVQILLLGTLIQFLFSPLTWTFVVMSFGLVHPVQTTLGDSIWLFVVVMTACEIVHIGTSAIAVAGRQHRHLIPWLPLMHVYYALGTFAVVKGLAELVTKPFYWDKTDHGGFH